MRDRSTKMMAVLMVSLMAVVALAPLAGEETDAAVGDGAAYSYTLTYHSDQMSSTAAQETQLTVDGMTPISHSNTGTLESLNAGSWTWNTATGIGPFNSFYGAFDMTNGNKFAGILNPYDLTEFIDETPIDDMTKYNIMWVLPTVYWAVDNSGNLTLTNDSSVGIAYAHTIDGHVYKYIAIGVYEGATKTIGTTSYFTSQSGVNPTSGNIVDLRDYSNNYTMDPSFGSNAHSMLWNFYQWELYKYCGLTVMEGFNSQQIVGNGFVYGNNSVRQTGSFNTNGPYAGKIGQITDNTTASSYGVDNVKLFIENAWGGMLEYVDGLTFYNSASIYIDTNSEPTTNTSVKTNVIEVAYSFPGGFPDAIETDAKVWGLGNNTTGSTSTGLTDRTYSDSGTKILQVGGASTTTGTLCANYGISCTMTNIDDNSTYSSYGSRLCFVFDDGIVTTYSVSFDIEGVGYGALSDSTTIRVEGGSEITITGTTSNVLTIGENTITATPTTDTSDYTYSFDGWFNGSTQLETGDTVNDDMTITAKFSRAAILTVTLDAGKGTVSSSSLTVIEGQPIGDLPTPTPKAGYTFIGWFDSEGNEVTSETIVTETESFTLYAQYELDDSLKPVKAMTDLLPLIFVVGIIILMIGTAFYYYRP